MEGLKELVNEMRADQRTRGYALGYYNRTLRLAKECYGDEVFKNPFLEDWIDHRIQTYLAFVQTGYLAEMYDLLRLQLARDGTQRRPANSRSRKTPL